MMPSVERTLSSEAHRDLAMDRGQALACQYYEFLATAIKELLHYRRRMERGVAISSPILAYSSEYKLHEAAHGRMRRLIPKAIN
jgi:hypothetical protein